MTVNVTEIRSLQLYLLHLDYVVSCTTKSTDSMTFIGSSHCTIHLLVNKTFHFAFKLVLTITSTRVAEDPSKNSGCRYVGYICIISHTNQHQFG